MGNLLTRDQFREGVFKRDGGKCVICGSPAVDAHHIIERRLFPDSGYYLDNGASVCAEHHYKCETTEISVEQIREACGVTTKVLPPEYYPDQPIDKWGNPILPNGRRLRGDLFNDESVQKVLAAGGKLQDFTKYVKYPRTWHLPWSDGVGDSDRSMEDVSCFEGKRVVVTEKMDGENTTMYNDFIHARSIDGRSHQSRDWVKNLHGRIAHEIPEGWRICGENLFAEHSIAYKSLPSYFMAFSIWDGTTCLSWDDTTLWANLLGLELVPELYRGSFDEKIIRGLHKKSDWDTHEGYVVRLESAFDVREFPRSAGKYVRANHLQTAKHWFYGQAIKPNALKGKS